MTEISEYMSNQDEIARLNKQIDMMAGFYKSYYKSYYIAYHKSRISELLRLIKRHSEMRGVEKRLKENVLKERASTVMALLRLKDKKVIDLSIEQISEAAFTNLSNTYKIKKQLGL